MEVVLRVTGGESSVIATLPSVLHSIDPDLSAAEIMTMNDRINNSQSATLRRGAAWLAGTFAGAALLLCAVGLYGVISYSVSLRTREIGVRMALGARRSTIYAAVLREASHLSLAGIVAGILLSVGSMSLLRSILFHVSSWDIPTLTGACVVLLLCAIVAALAPARRAARSDPTEALRSE
jgi:ABC-type antimicrobial peptide transport system permease subunit